MAANPLTLLRRLVRRQPSRVPGAPIERRSAAAPVWRALLNWVRQPLLSADREVAGDYLRLRAASRDAARTNNLARRYLKLAQANIVGPTGVQLRPKVTFRDGRPNDRINDLIAASWADWGRNAEITGLSWLEVQRLVVAEWVASGEVFIYFARSDDGLKLQLIDADRVDFSYNTRSGVRHGIEYDSLGRVVAYHVLDRHPSEGRGERVRVPASDMLHVYVREDRVGLSRGISPLAPALTALDHIRWAQEAALVSLRIAAAIPWFITSEETGPPDSYMTDALQQSRALSLDIGEPGQIIWLAPGEKPYFGDVQEPRDSFVDFTRSVTRYVAAALGTSYAFLLGDWSDTNYSSLRVGRADEQDNWRALQQWFIDRVCQPIFARWVVESVLAGTLVIPRYDASAIIANVEWQPRGWIAPNPAEDIEVAERRIALGLESRTELLAREGRNVWEVWEKLREEQDYASTLGISIGNTRSVAPTATRTASTTPNGNGRIIWQEK